ncbi:MAG: hypothetical protein K0S97_1369 [Chloroflexota bacterium]|nr:hypothetical protein [Chloroflexota bacterium]
MDLGTILKVAHAVLGVWIVAGLVGRWVTLGQAARSTDITAVHTLLGLSARFESMVIRIPPVVLLLGVATAIAQGRPFLGPLQGAPIDWLFVSIVIYLSILPVNGFRDRVVLAAHVYELAAIVVVFVLMITKPF